MPSTPQPPSTQLLPTSQASPPTPRGVLDDPDGLVDFVIVLRNADAVADLHALLVPAGGLCAMPMAATAEVCLLARGPHMPAAGQAKR